MMLPNFLIIGAQKSATSFVHQCLREHPDVFIPPDELPFFEDPDYSQGSITAFAALFKNGCDKKAIGMKRPNYLHKPECPGRIYRHIPHAKLIVILRDPVDRAVSAYYHQVKMGFAPLRSANKGLLQIIHGQHAERYPRTTEIIEFGFYYKHLTRYLEFFKREQLLLMLYDDIQGNPRHFLKTVFTFLSINEEYKPRSINSRPKAGVYSIPRLALLTLRNPIRYTYSTNRMRLFAKEGTGLLGSMFVRMINFSDATILSNVFSNNKPTLSPNLKRELSAVYVQDTSSLENLIGRSLKHWKVFQGNQ